MERGDCGSVGMRPTVTRLGRVGRRVGIVAGGATVLLLTASVAHADRAGEAAAPSAPGFFGLGAVGVVWLLVGSLALAVGLILATRQVGEPSPDRIGRTTVHVSASMNQSDGAKK